MEFTLTNNQRKCLGLPIIEEKWECIRLSETLYIYFDDNIIKKAITIKNNFYHECSLNEQTVKNRTYLAPKTSRGKEIKLTPSNLEKKFGVGTYFIFNQNFIRIGNYTNQLTFYYSNVASVKCNNFQDLKQWVDNWVSTTTTQDLKDIELSSSAQRKHCKFKEGDFFRFRVDRNLYGYGRIILDVNKLRKQKIPFWDILMGKPLIVKVYHILTSDNNVPIDVLQSCDYFPSQFIMDNCFLYGEYEIIGNKPLLEKDLDYPIMYGRNIDTRDPINIMFQQGKIFKSIPFTQDAYIGNYKNNGIGFILNVNKDILEQCINKKSNDPYWNYGKMCVDDLRNPINSEAKKRVFEQFNIK